MKEYKFNTTNYDDIENKSVWDLYVENFRDHLFDLCPSVASEEAVEEELAEDEAPELDDSKE